MTSVPEQADLIRRTMPASRSGDADDACSDHDEYSV
jgi:hypothetical protein